MAINSFNDIPTYSRHSGFTLLELTIVFVIIGLVAGGVLIGKDMIESSKVRAQVSQLQEYSTAVNTFKLKYNYLPGDMPWGQRRQFGLGTYGGGGWTSNGDGLLNSSGSTGSRQFGYMPTQEHSFFFQNLGKAELIPIKYCSAAYDYNEDGVYAVGSCNYGNYAMVGKSFPAMQLNARLGILPFYSRDFGGHWWVLGARSYSHWVGNTNEASLTPAQALQLDTKIDNGIPGTGTVKAVKDAENFIEPGVYDGWFEVDNLPATGCVTSAASVAYNLANTTIVCQVIVKW